MTSFWMGQRVRLRGIEPDDWTAFMRFAADEERLGDLLCLSGFRPRRPNALAGIRARREAVEGIEAPGTTL
jgi:hypothetical protein